MSEIVFLAHNNTIDLLLKADGVAQDLSNVTKITATFRATTIISEDHVSGSIKWDNAGYATGEIRLDLGGQTIAARSYCVPIVVYDLANTDGVVWGYVPIEVKADVEN
jgi:copper chaperone CopZ